MHLSPNGRRRLNSIPIYDYPYWDIVDDELGHYMDVYESMFKQNHLYKPDTTSWCIDDNRVYAIYTSKDYTRLLCPYCHSSFFHKITNVNRCYSCKTCRIPMVFVDND